MMTMTRMTPSTAGTADPTDAGPMRYPDRAGTAWGACRIRLVADRVPSLRVGSTHKVYRGWRFAAVMQQGHPRPGTALFTVPVDAAQLASSRSRYALAQLTTPEAMTGEATASFSWSASTIGTADPFAEAQAQAQRRLEEIGWTQDAKVPTQYAKSDPSVPTGEAAAASSPDITGLDAWEMDGGA